MILIYKMNAEWVRVPTTDDRDVLFDKKGGIINISATPLNMALPYAQLWISEDGRLLKRWTDKYIRLSCQR